MDILVKKLKELKNIRPDRAWVASQREILLSQITRQSTAKPQPLYIKSWYLTKSLLPSNVLRFVARPVGVFTMIFSVVFCSGILGVNASRSSLPGDMLYGVKLTSERVQVGMTMNKPKKAEMHVDLAERRVTEMETIAAQPESTQEDKNDRIQIAAVEFKKEIEETKNQLEAVKTETAQPQEIVDSAKRVDEKTGELSDRLVAINEAIPAAEVKKDLTEATVLADEAAVKAVEVIVDKHEKGEVTISEVELVQSIQAKLQKAEDGVVGATLAVAQATAATATATAATAEADALKADNLAADVASVSPAVTTGSEEVKKDETKPVEPSFEERKAELKGDDSIVKLELPGTDAPVVKPADAEKKLTEAKDLLSQGDLSSAIAKIKESNEIVKQVATSVTEINTTAAANSAAAAEVKATETAKAVDAANTANNVENKPIATVSEVVNVGGERK